MKRKQYHISLPGQKLSPEQVQAKEKMKRREQEREGIKAVIPVGFLGKPRVAITVFSILGATILFLALYYWLGMKPATGSITGTVLFEGKPVTGGRITFIPVGRGKPSASGAIDLMGRYTVKGCPTGPARITIETFAPAEGPAEPPKDVPVVKRPPKIAPKGTHVKIPEEYSNAAKTKLQYTVTAGSQTHEVDIP